MPAYHTIFPPRAQAERPARQDRRDHPAAAPSNLQPIYENVVAKYQQGPTLHFTPLATPYLQQHLDASTFLRSAFAFHFHQTDQAPS